MGPVLPSQQGVGSRRFGKDGPYRAICWDLNLGPTPAWEQTAEVQLPVSLLQRQLCVSPCAYIITQHLSLLVWDMGQAAPTRSRGDVPALTGRQSFRHAWLKGLRTTPLFLSNHPLPALLRTTAGSAGHRPHYSPGVNQLSPDSHCWTAVWTECLKPLGSHVYKFEEP